MPARNEGRALAKTIASIIGARSQNYPIEIVIADDASSDGCCRGIGSVARGVPIRVVRTPRRLGVAGARNYGVEASRGDVIFMTDAHVAFNRGWDRIVARHIESKRILAATIVNSASVAKGFGCRLVVPYMGTHWNARSPGRLAPVQVASAAGTILTRAMFDRIGGYDDGMIIYGGAEPEFSLRAWLSGAEVVSVPQLEVGHRFKDRPQRDRFLQAHRSFLIHNNLRFGLLYLSDKGSLEMLRHFAMKFPRHIRKALRLVDSSDVWQRRRYLERTLPHRFGWFVEKFALKDQAGREIR
jgi:glycosyltransferase involved in cell wall biosynthesis